MVIGVTGSFGTGKSTVARMLARRGAQVLSADAQAHALMRLGTPVWRRLRRRFGPAVFHADGTVDRRALSRAGFASARAWRALCRIVHPAVIADTRRRLWAIRRRASRAVVVLDVPLLIESGMTRLVDQVVVVTAPPRTAAGRLARAGRWSSEEIRRRLRWQMSLTEKQRVADVVIDNGGSRRATEGQVQALWKRMNEEKTHG